MTDWTTPEDVARQIASLWNRGRILCASLTDTPVFPLVVRTRRPNAGAIATDYEGVRQWIATLEAGSKAIRGFGYEIQWAETNHRLRGRNRIPAGIRVETEADALRLIGKGKEAERFKRLAAATLASFPLLASWLARAPLTVLEHAAEWERILLVLQWCRDHPNSGLYLRQLDIPGVDSKFIEDRKALLAVLLDQILPSHAIHSEFVGTRSFEQRYGLRFKPTLVRFRILDPRLRVHGLSDISVPLSELAQLDMPVRNVFITENDINGVAFPDVPASIVIFGLGYGIDVLAECAWIANTNVWYWGDLDTHGFAMLDRLRAFLPHACSLLMDRETLLAHRSLWIHEAEPHTKRLDRLTTDELAVYDDLRSNGLGDRVRLEQERIGADFMKRALSSSTKRV